MGKCKMCAAYDEDGICIGVADSIQELADMLHVDRTTIYSNIRRRTGKYAYVLSDEELDKYEQLRNCSALLHNDFV